MARRLRIKVPGHAAAYHVVSRTSQQDFLLDDHMKKTFIKKLKALKQLYYVRPISFAVLDNHFHALLCFRDPEDIDPKEAITRWNDYHDKEYKLNASVPAYREYVVQQLTDVSSFMKRLNLLLTREYNRHTGKTGSLWQSRYHSTIFERGIPVLQCTAYIELNSFRASIVNRPEAYEYSSLNYLKQGNKDDLIDIDLLEEGLGIAAQFKDLSDDKAYTKEIYSTLLAYVYEAGTEAKGGKERGIVITPEMQKQLKDYEIEVAKGSFLRRAWDFSRSIFVGSSDYARRFYEDHINPGYTGHERRNHISRWIHTSGADLWSIFSVFHKGWNMRGSP